MTGRWQEAASFFLPQQEFVSRKPLSGGIVNESWLITCRSGEKYVLQRLNGAVFPDFSLIQSNLHKITKHLRHRLASNHAIDLCSERPKSNFILFHPVSNPAGISSYKDQDGACWRMLTYIDHSRSLHTVNTLWQAEEIGRTLGLFHQLISTLPADSLADPLPGFHNTPLYLAQYDAIPTAALHPESEDCRNFIDHRRQDVFLLDKACEQGGINRQVIHGDPKVANFLFSSDTDQVISLIDFDTVKPGLLLHDLGDCLRSCCNPLGESVQQPEDIVFEPELFAAVLKGYLSHAADLLSSEDRRLIVASARLISLELGIRFYSDYLQGNTYFKVEYPEQNLFRARVQFALVRSIEQQYRDLVAIINRL